IIATSGLSGDDFSEAVRGQAPCVFFDGVLHGVGAGSVRAENEAGIKLLVDHLVGHGHSRIAFVSGPDIETSGLERLQGFGAAMESNGLGVVPDYLRASDWSQESGRHELVQLMGLSAHPTAVVAA